nr:immunoglobulin heavy chain junction region [Macaca mulatta]MOX63834.1 immunoglobulin heavy chain junction region [Macaca mulatta]MOX64310.1 immunoglobulin heavy chain junction region [Macaca mulatta]MOX64928.1 immunoglobulin heavy chain junction region [Macaca mulatta]MOX67161.1 immunoglobulin heavy chain junction region [Macaca mulatta]
CVRERGEDGGAGIPHYFDYW